MKLPLYKRIFFLLILQAGVLIFSGLLCNVYAQQADTAKKVTPSKSKRVLYGMASFYANKFNGRKTATGEIFNQNKYTCACNVLPLNTWIKVTNLRNGRTVVVRTNDRLHPKMNRIADLTRVAASKLGYISSGLTRVKIEVLGKKAPL